jgi:hypothetical protein
MEGKASIAISTLGHLGRGNMRLRSTGARSPITGLTLDGPRVNPYDNAKLDFMKTLKVEAFYLMDEILRAKSRFRASSIRFTTCACSTPHSDI